MKTHLFTFFLLFILNWANAQSPVVVSIPYAENFGSSFNVGEFPLGNNNFITQAGASNSFKTTKIDAESYQGSFFDATVAGIASFDGINIIPITTGLGPYCYINNSDAALLISNKVLIQL